MLVCSKCTHIYFESLHGCRLCRLKWDLITLSSDELGCGSTEPKLQNSSEAIHEAKLRRNGPSRAEICNTRVPEMAV